MRWGRRDIKTVQLLAPSMCKMMAKKKNKDDAINRLEKLFNDIKIQARRIPTKPSRSSKVKRVETKKKRSKLKKSRMKVGLND